ncbi:MAG: hypothetical protein DCC58_00315 [Chloroflexi bacterium]|nr:MAG: hypothetical protein DCC58_00315 [Chloroflexota bacterium]
MTNAITFDFHDTLASCDHWFRIEVRDLVPEVLGWYDRRNDTRLAERYASDAYSEYRQLRRSVIAAGDEIDAVRCTQLVLERLGLAFEDDVLEEAVDAVMQSALADVSPVPGAIDALREIAEAGVPIGIVSSAVHHRFLEWTLAEFGIRDLVQSVVTSASCGFYKSRTEIYTHSVDVLGVSPDRCVHIGDSYEFDVRTAGRAGLKTIWYRTQPSVDPGDDADLIVDTLVGVAPRALALLGS